MKELLSLFAPVSLLVWQVGAPQMSAGSPESHSDSHLVREGSDWVQISSGSFTICSTCRLKINTEGNVVLRGNANAQSIKYSVKKRVRAVSSTQALQLLREFVVRPGEQGNLVTLTLIPPRRGASGADLSVSIPRALRQAVVESTGGDITATDLDGEVQTVTAAGRIEIDRLGANAAIRTGGGEIRIGHVAGGVRCYSGGGGIRADQCGRESWFETAGGDISIREALAALHASTAGGNIRVDHAGGAVSVRTAAGVIDVQQASGLVTAETSGGAIQVGEARGVRCQSVAGAIRLHNVGDGPLRASTAAGSILAQLSGTWIEDSLLSTNAGDITVLLSSNLPVTVQARNETAGGGRRIVSDFPEIRIRNAAGIPFPMFAEGVLNGGGPILRIFASGGTIYLRRQK